MNKNHKKALIACIAATAVLSAGICVANNLVNSPAAVGDGLTFEEAVAQQDEARRKEMIGNKDLTAIPDITSSSSSSSQPAYNPNGENKPNNNVIIEKTEDGEKVTPDWQKPSAPAEKPKLPEGTDTSNPNSKPSYGSQPTIESGKSSTPAASSSSQASAQPKNGATRVYNGENQIYINGFGWVPQVQPAQGEVADFKITGNQVGIM
jgi:outer membrane biosynthesis protein TonB